MFERHTQLAMLLTMLALSGCAHCSMANRNAVVQGGAPCNDECCDACRGSGGARTARHRGGDFADGEAGYGDGEIVGSLARFHPVPTRPVFGPLSSYDPPAVQIVPAPASDMTPLHSPPQLPPRQPRQHPTYDDSPRMPAWEESFELEMEGVEARLRQPNMR